ncbi:endo-1,3-alpha-glucanase family glycosylhydrolase [Thermococcus barossii]|uniref:Uncharacterized protein n=1 Tax=Thermococcus barossii TaxID=54077 RepID=A0A2Z2MHQ7_9EURY|nr:endo-1,3-alpha-glucanase family glycosylhydrolase [Thermococcus barossii]ASJ04282.1 hypothetical protein A3L01_02480 [Thermococcus barossii]
METLKSLRLLVILIVVQALFISPHYTHASDSIDNGPKVYRIVMTIVTTSDWTTISSDGIEFLNSKITVLQGDGSGLRVWHSGNKVGITKSPFNMTLVKANITLIINLTRCEGLTLKIQKGDIGYSYVRIVNINSETPVPVGEFNNSGSIQNDSTNLREFPVSCEKIKQNGPLSLPSGDGIPKMVWAFYYPWYRAEQWDSDPALIDVPLLGKYSSSDPRAIRAHIKLAKAAGIDGFIVSWWGEGTYTDQNLKKILPIAAEEGFKVAIYLESLGGGGKPRPPNELKDMLRYFFRTYGSDERYFHLWGKPVIFVWAAGVTPLEVWKEIFEDLREEGYGGVYIANTLNPKYLEVFDGLHTYATINLDLRKVYPRAFIQCKTYPLLEETPKPRIWAATISPGYDDRHIPGREGHFQPRMDGEYYMYTFEAAVDSNPDWLLITTFNEFPENTFIEPSRKYGFKYVLMTANFTATFKGTKPNITAVLELKERWRLEEFEEKPPVETESRTETKPSTTTQSPTTTLPPSTTTSTASSHVHETTTSHSTESLGDGGEETSATCGTGVFMLIVPLVRIFTKQRKKEL